MKNDTPQNQKSNKIFQSESKDNSGQKENTDNAEKPPRVFGQGFTPHRIVWKENEKRIDETTNDK